MDYDYQIHISRAERAALVGLVRRARAHAQRRYERRHYGPEDPTFRKARGLRDLLVKLLRVEGGRS